MRFVRESLAWAGLIVTTGVLLTQWDSIPTQVPQHFDFAGHATRIGSKSGLIIFPIIAVFLYCLLTAITYFPNLFNYPVPVTASNRERLRGLALSLVGWIKAETVWIFAWLTIETVRVATGRTAQLNSGFGLAAVGLPILTIVLFLWRMLATED